MRKHADHHTAISDSPSLSLLRARGVDVVPLLDGYAAKDSVVKAAGQIRAMRKVAGLSQMELANAAGMSQADLSRIESGLGIAGPSVETVSRLASSCGYEFSLTLHPSALTSTDQELTTAQTLHTLGETYMENKKYKKAESVFDKSINTRKRLLGDKSLETAKTANCLAVCYLLQHEYQKLKSMASYALEIRWDILGDEDSETARSKNNLAISFVAEKEYEKAEPLLLEALGTLDQILGAAHPDTVRAASNLAILKQHQNQNNDNLHAEFLAAL